MKFSTNKTLRCVIICQFCFMFSPYLTEFSCLNIHIWTGMQWGSKVQLWLIWNRRLWTQRKKYGQSLYDHDTACSCAIMLINWPSVLKWISGHCASCSRCMLLTSCSGSLLDIICCTPFLLGWRLVGSADHSLLGIGDWSALPTSSCSCSSIAIRHL